MTPTAAPQPATTEPAKKLRKKAERYHGPLTLDAVATEPYPGRRGVDLTEFLPLVRKAWEDYKNGETTKGLGFTVPTAAIPTMTRAFYLAAVEVGCSISVTSAKAGEADPKYNLLPEQSRMWIKAAPKRVRKAKPATTEAAKVVKK